MRNALLDTTALVVVLQSNHVLRVTSVRLLQTPRLPWMVGWETFALQITSVYRLKESPGRAGMGGSSPSLDRQSVCLVMQVLSALKVA